VNVSTALETNTEAPEVMQPGTRAFNNPPLFAKAAVMFDARGPAADVRKIKGVEIDELRQVIPAFLYCGEAQNDRLLAQIKAKKRVWRIGVWRLNRLTHRPDAR
jgi:hypothetical protein